MPRGPICSYVTQARSINGALGELKGAHAHVPERAAMCRGAGKNAAHWPSGLHLALQLAFTWPLRGPSLTHTRKRGTERRPSVTAGSSEHCVR